MADENPPAGDGIREGPLQGDIEPNNDVINAPNVQQAAVQEIPLARVGELVGNVARQMLFPDEDVARGLRGEIEVMVGAVGEPMPRVEGEERERPLGERAYINNHFAGRLRNHQNEGLINRRHRAAQRDNAARERQVAAEEANLNADEVAEARRRRAEAERARQARALNNETLQRLVTFLNNLTGYEFDAQHHHLIVMRDLLDLMSPGGVIVNNQLNFNRRNMPERNDNHLDEDDEGSDEEDEEEELGGNGEPNVNVPVVEPLVNAGVQQQQVENGPVLDRPAPVVEHVRWGEVDIRVLREAREVLFAYFLVALASCRDWAATLLRYCIVPFHFIYEVRDWYVPYIRFFIKCLLVVVCGVFLFGLLHDSKDGRIWGATTRTIHFLNSASEAAFGDLYKPNPPNTSEFRENIVQSYFKTKPPAIVKLPSKEILKKRVNIVNAIVTNIKIHQINSPPRVKVTNTGYTVSESKPTPEVPRSTIKVLKAAIVDRFPNIGSRAALELALYLHDDHNTCLVIPYSADVADGFGEAVENLARIANLPIKFINSEHKDYLYRKVEKVIKNPKHNPSMMVIKNSSDIDEPLRNGLHYVCDFDYEFKHKLIFPLLVDDQDVKEKNFDDAFFRTLEGHEDQVRPFVSRMYGFVALLKQSGDVVKVKVEEKKEVFEKKENKNGKHDEEVVQEKEKKDETIQLISEPETEILVEPDHEAIQRPEIEVVSPWEDVVFNLSLRAYQELPTLVEYICHDLKRVKLGAKEKYRNELVAHGIAPVKEWYIGEPLIDDVFTPLYNYAVEQRTKNVQGVQSFVKGLNPVNRVFDWAQGKLPEWSINWMQHMVSDTIEMVKPERVKEAKRRLQLSTFWVTMDAKYQQVMSYLCDLGEKSGGVVQQVVVYVRYLDLTLIDIVEMAKFVMMFFGLLVFTYNLVFHNRYINLNLSVYFSVLYSACYLYHLFSLKDSSEVQLGNIVSVVTVFLISLSIIYIRLGQSDRYDRKINNTLQKSENLEHRKTLMVVIFLYHIIGMGLAYANIGLHRYFLKVYMALDMYVFESTKWLLILGAAVVLLVVSVRAKSRILGSSYYMPILLGCVGLVIVYFTKNLWQLAVSVLVFLLVRSFMCTLHYIVNNWLLKTVVYGLTYNYNETPDEKMRNIAAHFIMTTFKVVMVMETNEYINFVIMLPYIYNLCFYSSWVDVCLMVVIIVIAVAIYCLLIVPTKTTTTSADVKVKLYDVTYFRTKTPDTVLLQIAKETAIAYLKYLGNLELLQAQNLHSNEAERIRYIRELANKTVNAQNEGQKNQRQWVQWANDHTTREAARRSDMLIRAAMCYSENQRPDILAGLERLNNIEVPNFIGAEVFPAMVQEVQNLRIETLPLERFRIPEGEQDVRNVPKVSAETAYEAAHKAGEILFNKGEITENEKPNVRQIIPDDMARCKTGDWGVLSCETSRNQVNANGYDLLRNLVLPRLKEMFVGGDLSLNPIYSLPAEGSIYADYKSFLIDNKYVDAQKGIGGDMAITNQGYGGKSETNGVSSFARSLIEGEVVVSVMPDVKTLNKLLVKYFKQQQTLKLNPFEPVKARDFFASIDVINWELPEGKMSKIKVLHRHPDIYFALKMPSSAFGELEYRKNVEVCCGGNCARPNFVAAHETRRCEMLQCEPDSDKFLVKSAWVQRCDNGGMAYFNYSQQKKIQNRSVRLSRDLFCVRPLSGAPVGNCFIAAYDGRYKVFTAAHNIVSRADGRPLGPGEFSTIPLAPEALPVTHPYRFDPSVTVKSNEFGVKFICPKSFLIENVAYGRLKISDYEIRGEAIIGNLPHFAVVKPENEVGILDLKGEMLMARLDVVDDCWIPQRLPIVYKNKKFYYTSVAGDSGSPLFCNRKIFGLHVGGMNQGYATHCAVIGLDGSVQTLDSYRSNISNQEMPSAKKEQHNFRGYMGPSHIKLSNNKMEITYEKNGELVTTTLGRNEISKMKNLLRQALEHGGAIKVENGNDAAFIENLTLPSDYEGLNKELDAIMGTIDDGYVSGEEATEAQLIASKVTLDRLRDILGDAWVSKVMENDENDAKRYQENIKTGIKHLKTEIAKLKLQEEEIVRGEDYKKMMEEFKTNLDEYNEGKKNFLDMMAEYKAQKTISDLKRKEINDRKNAYHAEIKSMMKDARAKFDEDNKDIIKRLQELNTKAKEGVKTLSAEDVKKEEELKNRHNLLKAKSQEIHTEMSQIKEEKKELNKKIAPLSAQDQAERTELNTIFSQRLKDLQKELEGYKTKNKEYTEKTLKELTSTKMPAPICPPKPYLNEPAELKKIREEILKMSREVKLHNKQNTAIETLIKESIANLEKLDNQIYTCDDNKIEEHCEGISVLLRDFSPADLDEIVTQMMARLVFQNVEEGVYSPILVDTYIMLMSIAKCWDLRHYGKWCWVAHSLEQNLMKDYKADKTYLRNRCREMFAELDERYGKINPKEIEVDEVQGQTFQITKTVLTPKNVNTSVYLQNMPSYTQPCTVVCPKCMNKVYCKQGHVGKNTGTLMDECCTLSCHRTVIKCLNDHKLECEAVSNPQLPTGDDMGHGLTCSHSSKSVNIRLCPLHTGTKITCVSPRFFKNGTSIVINLDSEFMSIKAECLVGMITKMCDGHKLGECTDELSPELQKAAKNGLTTEKPTHEHYHEIGKDLYFDFDFLSEQGKYRAKAYLMGIIPNLKELPEGPYPQLFPSCDIVYGEVNGVKMYDMAEPQANLTNMIGPYIEEYMKKKGMLKKEGKVKIKKGVKPQRKGGRRPVNQLLETKEGYCFISYPVDENGIISLDEVLGQFYVEEDDIEITDMRANEVDESGSFLGVPEDSSSSESVSTSTESKDT